jgi:hypothetical protein
MSKNFEIRSEDDVRIPPYTLKIIREAFDAADRRGCDPSTLYMRIDDIGISVWNEPQDKAKTPPTPSGEELL